MGEFASSAMLILLALAALLNAPSVILFLVFSCIVMFRDRPAVWPIQAEDDHRFPEVLVQIPTYNEPDVIGRALEAVARLDWPRDRLHLQVLDDSTDHTPAVASAAIKQLEQVGLNAELRHRARRDGFKAGALQQGLEASKAPFIAILDADYVPAPDWLRACVGLLLGDEKLAFVQSRIDYLNGRATWFTRGQAMLLDVHYVIEQGGRDMVGLVVPFNGTCGIWRRTAIEAVGGWRGDTLVEDMDLSFRVVAQGWQTKYLLDVSVPGELPERLRDWAGQQKRWAMGTAQVTRRRMRDLVRRSTNGRIRLSLLYQVLNIFAGQTSLLAIGAGSVYWAFDRGTDGYLVTLSVVAAALILIRAVVMPIVAQGVVGKLTLGRALVDVPCYIVTTVLGTAYATIAAIRGLLGHRAPFVRTRKTGATSFD